MIKCSVANTNVSGLGATSVSCRSDSEGEAETVVLLQGGELEARRSVIGAVKKVGVVVSLVFNKVFVLLLFHFRHPFVVFFLMGFVFLLNPSRNVKFQLFLGWFLGATCFSTFALF